jgi:hypothetical protein
MEPGGHRVSTWLVVLISTVGGALITLAVVIPAILWTERNR